MSNADQSNESACTHRAIAHIARVDRHPDPGPDGLFHVAHTHLHPDAPCRLGTDGQRGAHGLTIRERYAGAAPDGKRYTSAHFHVHFHTYIHAYGRVNANGYAHSDAD